MATYPAFLLIGLTWPVVPAQGLTPADVRQMLLEAARDVQDVRFRWEGHYTFLEPAAWRPGATEDRHDFSGELMYSLKYDRLRVHEWHRSVLKGEVVQQFEQEWGWNGREVRVLSFPRQAIKGAIPMATVYGVDAPTDFNLLRFTLEVYPLAYFQFPWLIHCLKAAEQTPAYFRSARWEFVDGRRLLVVTFQWDSTGTSREEYYVDLQRGGQVARYVKYSGQRPLWVQNVKAWYRATDARGKSWTLPAVVERLALSTIRRSNGRLEEVVTTEEKPFRRGVWLLMQDTVVLNEGFTPQDLEVDLDQASVTTRVPGMLEAAAAETPPAPALLRERRVPGPVRELDPEKLSRLAENQAAELERSQREASRRLWWRRNWPFVLLVSLGIAAVAAGLLGIWWHRSR